jgi:hypothetical protein
MTRSAPTRLAVWTVALALPFAAAYGSSERAAPGKPAKPSGKSAAKGCAACLEKGAVLDPSLFESGYERDVPLAYAAAKKYPDLIDRLHCFCECKENQREHHKTLLTCFTNQHAAGCGICQHEAIMAAQLKDRGVSDDEAEITVESLHKTEGHPPTFGRGL